MKMNAPDEMNRNPLIFSEILFDGYLIRVQASAELESHSSFGLNLFSRKPPGR
jgi:hypothetical protein